MGLNLSSVNKTYGFKKDGDEYKNNKEYFNRRISYGGYKFFRDDMVKFLTDNKLEKIEDFEIYFSNNYWYDDETFIIPMLEKDFTALDINNENKKKWLNTLQKLKLDFPKLYDCFAWLHHCDCEGIMYPNQLKPTISHLETFIKNMKEDYWAKDYAISLLEIFKSVIDNDGKLYFS